MVFDRFERTTKEGTGQRVYCECGDCEIKLQDGSDYEIMSSGSIPVLDFSPNPTLENDGCRAVLVDERTDQIFAVSE